VELGCLIGIAGIALKRNNDCYKAQCELVDEQMAHFKTQIDMIDKDYEIKVLKKELEKVKSQEKEEA
jgi:hypothetical protein